MAKQNNLKKTASIIDLLILAGAIISLGFWATGKGLFYSETSPVMSPFTAISLLLMVGGRLAERNSNTWPITLTMGWMGIAIGGNLSSIMIQALVPDLLLKTLPGIVPTSMMTSVGLIIFAVYELLILIRKTPKDAFIIDDLLLLLALVPGGISLLGHAIGNSSYISSALDPRVGISLFEMLFMGAYALVAIFCNRNLFLWRFLSANNTNKIIFIALGANQFIIPIILGLWLKPESGHTGVGIELFVMLAGVLATLTFLAFSAYTENKNRT